MKKNTWKRARNPEQREIRIAMILAAADKVFKTTTYDFVTMDMIAKKAKFTRSNLYRYFKTREEIFLSLFFEDLSIWLEDIQQHINKKMPLVELVAEWTTILCRQNRLLELGPLVATSLELNTSEELNTKATKIWKECLDKIVMSLHTAIPQYSMVQLHEFMYFHMVVLTGAIPMSDRAISKQKKNACKYLHQPKFQFEEFYKKNMLIFMKGLAQQK